MVEHATEISKTSSTGNIIVRPSTHPALTVFDAGHGQPNWAQTGFTSREMHTNFAGVMELLCRFGFTCTPTGLEPLVGGENLVVMASFDPRECLKRRQRATMRGTDEAKAYKGRRKGLAKGLPGECGGSAAKRG